MFTKLWNYFFGAEPLIKTPPTDNGPMATHTPVPIKPTDPPPTPLRRFTLNVCMVIFDGIDVVQSQAAMKEAVQFIQNFSRFDLKVTYLPTKVQHTYEYWPPPNGPRSMRREQMTLEFRNSLPVADFYLFLYKVFDWEPFQAGSSMGVADGILRGGKMRPYATMPADGPPRVWWWHDHHDPDTGGFKRRDASILAHEMINCLNNILAVAPYFCAPLVGTPSTDPYVGEANRLKALGDACYAKYGGIDG